jgi:hypothetical protein
MGNLSAQDASMDSHAQPRLSDLVRQNAAHDAAEAATRAARDASHQSDLEYLSKISRKQ